MLPTNPAKELDRLCEQYKALKELVLIEEDVAHKKAYILRLRRLQTLIDGLEREIAALPSVIQHPIQHLQKRHAQVSRIEMETLDAVNVTHNFKERSDELKEQRRAAEEQAAAERAAELAVANPSDESLIRFNHDRKVIRQSFRQGSTQSLLSSSQPPQVRQYQSQYQLGSTQSLQSSNPASHAQSSGQVHANMGYHVSQQLPPFHPRGLAPYPTAVQPAQEHLSSNFQYPTAPVVPYSSSPYPPPHSAQTGFRHGHVIGADTFGNPTELEAAGIPAHRRTQSNVSQQSSVYSHHTDSSHQSNSSGHSGQNYATSPYHNYPTTSRGPYYSYPPHSAETEESNASQDVYPRSHGKRPERYRND